MSRVLVTGASGFVGRALCAALAAAGHAVEGVTRWSLSRADAGATFMHTVPDQGEAAGWRPILDGVDSVVHLAARVHVIKESADDTLHEYRIANVRGTEVLAREAARAGVRRFVFMSTIKVMGEGTNSRPFRHGDRPSPADPYAISKCEAEVSLRRIAGDGGMQHVILRPTVVHGPGVGGNLRRVFDLVHRGIPLPLAAIDNARSMLALPNLCEVVELCLREGLAAGEIFLVADSAPVSTPELFRIVARRMNRPARLLPVPEPLLRAAGRLAGKSEVLDRLCGSLVVDIAHTQDVLGWSPAISTEEGLGAAVDHYLQHEAGKA